MSSLPPITSNARIISSVIIFAERPRRCCGFCCAGNGGSCCGTVLGSCGGLRSGEGCVAPFFCRKRPMEWALSTQPLINDNPECILITGRIRFAFKLFWCHVCYCSDYLLHAL